MAYKDKDKQREAVKLATRRYRERKSASVIPCDTRFKVIPEGVPVVIPYEKVEPQSHSPIVAGYVPPGRSRRSPQIQQGL